MDASVDALGSFLNLLCSKWMSEIILLWDNVTDVPPRKPMCQSNENNFPGIEQYCKRRLKLSICMASGDVRYQNFDKYSTVGISEDGRIGFPDFLLRWKQLRAHTWSTSKDETNSWEKLARRMK
ncbi:hypothetical protein BUALT_Bualt05G0119800 [Buddleja alternifolia]|uniref:Uncharacterized protein n=1 Tax=Buddleja alternifolia TaxID=168488 RepID=A0AAV6XIK9_9LAMI|nr:hypothetical protein BUALT_Bualt05G0119800 [Buddleja alternifolia]